MNDRNDPRARLVADAYHEDWNSGPMRELAQRAAAHARTRRRVRRTAGTTAVAACVLAIAVFAFRPKFVVPANVAADVAEPKTTRYEIISDEEFFTLIDRRPVLILPQQDGARRIVVIDR